METWEVEVGHLVRTFADALANLVPSLDRARIVWTPLGDRYDDFDRIAESLYTSIVISPALHDPRLSSLGVDEFRPSGSQPRTGGALRSRSPTPIFRRPAHYSTWTRTGRPSISRSSRPQRAGSVSTETKPGSS